jgi:hypothetical protein
MLMLIDRDRNPTLLEVINLLFDELLTVDNLHCVLSKAENTHSSLCPTYLQMISLRCASLETDKAVSFVQ